jgi:hypothetical protein
MRIEAFFAVSSHVMAAQEAAPGLRQARADDQLRAISRHLSPSSGATHRFVRVNEVTTYRRILHRSGTSARCLHEFKTTLRIAPPQVRIR